MNDWDVLNQHLSGDTAAIDLLVRKHIHFVYSTARRLVSAAEADDVVQAVFLLLTRKAAAIPHRGTLTGWLYRTTRFCCSNLRRVEARRRRHEMEAAMQSPPPATPEFADSAWLEALDSALDRLPTTDRDALLLHYLQQQTFEQTALAIGITAEAARKRTGRALEKLRSHFARSGYVVPNIAAVGASLQSATRSAPAVPAATVNASLLAAHGKANAVILSFAHSTAHLMAAAKLKATIITAVAAALTLTGTLWAIAALHSSPTPHITPTASPTPLAATPDSPLREAFLSALPEIQLDSEPSEAEAKSILKIRLHILNNVIARYSVHTEYPPPPNGWPAYLAARPADASLAPPFSIDRPATTLYPSGTTDAAKTLSLLDGRARYDSALIDARRLLPLPPGIREFTTQTFVAISDRPTLPDLNTLLPQIQRLFLGQSGEPLISDMPLTTRLPDPDLEIALALRLPFTGPSARQTTAQITPDLIDSMNISFLNANQALASLTFNRQKIEWSLDRSRAYTPIAFRATAPDNSETEMTINAFQQSASISLPAKITTTFKTPAALNSEDPSRIWRTETLTITSIEIRDPANTESLYELTTPANTSPAPSAPAATAVRLNGIEARLGTESFDSASVVGPLTTPPGSPSTPTARTDPYAVARHEQFVQQAQQGHIDLLLLGDKSIEDWPAQTALWQKYLAPHHAAAFGITADRVENLLWRINHGELAELAPKLIVLSIGSTDAAIDGRFAYGPGEGGRGEAFTYTPRLREDSPAAIVAGIQKIIQTLHEKSPTSKILLLGLCHATLNPNASPHFIARANAINQSLAQLDNHTTLRYLDLTPTFLDAAGALSPDLQSPLDLPSLYQSVYQRWGEAMDPLIKEMQ